MRTGKDRKTSERHEKKKNEIENRQKRRKSYEDKK